MYSSCVHFPLINIFVASTSAKNQNFKTEKNNNFDVNPEEIFNKN